MRQEMMGFGDGSGISWTIYKQSAPRSRQITTPTPHHAIFTGQMIFLTPNQKCQNTKGTTLYRLFCTKVSGVQILETVFMLLLFAGIRQFAHRHHTGRPQCSIPATSQLLVAVSAGQP